MLLSAATHLVVSASSNGIAGDAWNFEVQAEDNTNTVDATYSGTVHFTSGDGQAVLPGDSTLSSGGGFFNVTLKTSGVQSIVATDAANNAITGSTATHVFAAAATHLAVSEPATALVTKTFSFTV
ncbi:MAG TPA: hypothetical protein VLJ39_15275, partial [Tepidisphaeraceae bacterium]|nr:hypothetical protein [Tepidisphaeraceae bacterium]